MLANNTLKKKVQPIILLIIKLVIVNDTINKSLLTLGREAQTTKID